MSKRQWLSLSMIALIAALALSIGAWAHQARPASAAGAGPIIHWDSSMIYAGQNNGDPWGPVGEHAIVHGANFLPGVQLNIVLARGNSNQQPSLCKTPVATVGTVNTSSGTFALSFTWPSSAGAVNGIYSVCALSARSGLTASYRDDGPFTVLSGSAPTISVSSGSVQAGSTITVSGQNWVPPQPVSINVTGGSQLVSATPTSSGLNAGTFSVTLNIPSSAQPGGYVVSAFTSNNTLHAGNQNISITASATATPTATPSPTPSPTGTASPTSTATVTGGSTAGPGNTPTSASSTTGTSSSGNSGGPSPIILGVLIAIALVLLTSIGLIIFMVLRRSDPQQKRPLATGRTTPARPYNGGAFANNAYSPDGIQQGNASYNNLAIPDMPTTAWQQQQTGSSNLYNQPTMFEPSTAGYNQAPGTSAPATQAYQPPASPLPSTGTWGREESPPLPAESNIPRCMNCGRPLLPNAVRCDACGTPTGLYPGW